MTINAPFGYAFQQHTISSTALSLLDCSFTQDEIDNAVTATITVTGNPVRFSVASTPTASAGHYVGVGGSVTVSGNDIQNLLLIRATGSDGSVAITLSGTEDA